MTEDAGANLARTDPGEDTIVKLQLIPAGGVLPEGDLIPGAAFVIIEDIFGERAAGCLRIISDVNHRLCVHDFETD